MAAFGSIRRSMEAFWHLHFHQLTKPRRVILGLLLAFLSVAVLAFLILARADLHPPEIGVVSVEPAGMFDDRGMEMRLVTLAIRNDNAKTGRSPDRNGLYVADSPRGLEVKVGESWKRLTWATNLWGFETRLEPGNENQSSLALVPGGKDRCRVWLKYAVPSVSPKGLLELGITWLPLSVRSRISYKFWRWVGFPGVYRPGHWREVSIEVPLVASSGEPKVNRPQ